MLAEPAVVQNLPLTERMLLAEDARAQTDAELAPLREGLRNRDPEMRRQAARAHRPAREGGADSASDPARWAMPTPMSESKPPTRSASLAAGPEAWRDAKSPAPRPDPDRKRTARLGRGRGDARTTSLYDRGRRSTGRNGIATGTADADVHAVRLDAVLGAVEGLEALARQSGKISRLSGPTLTGLRAASELEGRAQDAEKLTRIRRFASLALMASGGARRTGSSMPASRIQTTRSGG